MSILKIKHFLRFLGSFLPNTKVAIIGGYHGGNLGDMALGLAVKEILQEEGIKGNLQTIYNVDVLPWKKMKYVIVGGGAVGYKNSLLRIVNKYEGSYKKLGFLGVDFNEFDYRDNRKVMELLSDSKWLSCRSQAQSNKMKDITGRDDINFHPDIVYSYRTKFCIEQRNKSIRDKKLLINVVPLYSKIIDGKLVANKNYVKERPELYENYDSMISNYRKGVREIALKALNEGYKVETISFTPQDLITAKTFLEGINVTHIPYDSNPFKVLVKMSKAELIFATRYHATIFALKTGAKIIPMAYAKKSEKMLHELGIDRSDYSTSEDLANGEEMSKKYLSFNDSIISDWERKSKENIKNCLKSIIS